MTNEYDFLKKQRYEYYKGTTEIMDNEVNELVEDVVDVLNKKSYNINEFLKIKQFQAQRIAELEEQLKNAIVPKFKIGQEVWYTYNKYQKFPFKCVIDKIVYDSSKNYKFRYDTSDEYYICVKEEDLFATKEEAQTKLQELKGE